MKEKSAQVGEKQHNLEFREYPYINHEFSNQWDQCKEILLNFSDQQYSA